MKYILLTVIFYATAMSAQAAPGINIYGGAYSWHSETKGTFASVGQAAVDLDSDLDFGSDSNTVFYLGVEHVVPVLPNVRLSYVDLENTANGHISNKVTIDNNTFNSVDVASSHDLKMTDLTLYYRPLKKPVKLKVGLNIRQVDAALKVASTGKVAKLSAKQTFPMGYLGASANLPFGFYAAGEINAIGYDGNQLTDGSVKLGWRSDYLLGIEAGYRAMKIKLDDISDINTDIKFQGPYVSLTLTF